MSERVLITGASGGIGSAAMRELRARGAQVVGLDTRIRMRRLVRAGRFAKNGLAGELAARLSGR